jgi:MFS family permease
MAVSSVDTVSTTTTEPTTGSAEGWFSWWREASTDARRALLAAGFGWMLDAFDVMLFALVLPAVSADLGLTRIEGGLLGSVMLVSAAFGGVAFGWFADRFGRTRALMLSVTLYSVFTAACGLSTNLTQFIIFRILLGIGMGGEWASGAALVSETWPAKHRGKALGLMQSGWAIGYAAAALVNGLVLPTFGWRAVFFVGILPAFLTIWVRRYVKEPAIWVAASRAKTPGTVSGLGALFHGDFVRLTIALTLMNACTLFAWWGFNLWLPSYLRQPLSEGGVGLSATTMSNFVAFMQVGMWFGYVTFGFVSDSLGRKRTYVVYLLCAATLLFVYVSVPNPLLLLILGPFVAFFATGYFSGFGAVTAEIYPTTIRATAQGFTYNTGRIVSAAAPFTVGTLATTHGFGPALMVSSVAFVLAAIVWFWIPETKGRALA